MPRSKTTFNGSYGRRHLWIAVCVGMIIVGLSQQTGAETRGSGGTTQSADAHSPGARPADRQLCDIGEEPAYHPRRLLVRFRPGITHSARQAAHDAAEAKGILREYHVVDGLQLVEVTEDKLPAALAAYGSHPDVLYAEPDYIVHVDGIPNDPYFDQLWGLHNWGQTVNGDPGTPGADIRATEAWDFWTGDPDFRIAVIDTGVDYDHPDLQANIWTNPDEIPGNEIDDDGNGYVDDIHGYDFYNEDGDPMDEYGHGSHVAGTIGAVANNSLGVVGVNWQCKIVALKFIQGG